MTINKDNEGFIFCTCKHCGELFPLYDKTGKFKDLPPDGKNYCPKCTVAQRNKDKRIQQKQKPEEFLKEQNITNKNVIKFFKRKYKEFGTEKTYQKLLKEAIEEASYRE